MKGYETFKVFCWQDIEDETGVWKGDVFFNIDDESAKKWWVSSHTCTDDDREVNKWLLQHGAEEGDIVFLDMSID